MQLKETARIVARVGEIDRRDVTDTLIATWHEIVGHLPYDVAVEALRIVASESPETIKPAHLLRARGAARAQIERRAARAARQRALDAQTRPMRSELLASDLTRALNEARES